MTSSKIVLTQRAAEAIVDAGVSSRYAFTQEYDESRETISYAPIIRLARLQTEWARNEERFWQATACFVVGDKVDKSYEFDVFAPLAASKPTGVPQNQRFYVVWRGRWESMQTLPFIPTYKSGNAIQVQSDGTGNYTVVNDGLTNAIVYGENYNDRGTLYFDPRRFKWQSSSADIPGKKEVTIKTISKNVVTNVEYDENGRLVVKRERVTLIE